MARVLEHLQRIEPLPVESGEADGLMNNGASDQSAIPSEQSDDGAVASLDSWPTSSPVSARDQNIKTEFDAVLPDDRDRPDRLSGIRPVGTKGLPDAYVRPLKQQISLDIPANADVPDRFIAALDVLVGEIRRTGAGRKRYELENGRRGDPSGSDILYVFPFTDEADIFEDAQVDVLIDGRRIEGTIASIAAGRLILALKEQVGPEVRSAVLLVDATALLEALRLKIEAAKKSEISLNRALADPVIGMGTWPNAPEVPIEARASDDLNPAQSRACRHALEAAITFIWGPPGCGKTRTLAEIARSALEGEKRVLICSNTNKAVDQVLYQLCKSLGPEHRAMQEGNLVRWGRIADNKLESEYRQFVTIDGIVERRSTELNAEKQRVEEKIGRLEAPAEQARTILGKFAALDRAEQLVAMQQEKVNQLTQNGQAAKAEMEHSARQANEFAAELKRRNAAFFKFLRRKEAQIQADIQRNATERIAVNTRLEGIRAQYVTMRQLLEQAQRDRDTRLKAVAGEDRTAAAALVAQTEEERARLVATLCDIQSTIDAIRDSVLRDARIIGATCTKTYLSPKDIGHADLVIIDEASMVLLPVAWFSAGLARERVVISGDFRQLPPIIPTQERKVFEVLGHDPFKATGLTGLDDPRLLMLDTQYRMRPEICHLIAGPMYDNRLRTAPNRISSPAKAPPIPFDGPLTLIDSSDLWPFEGQTVFHSRFNMLHALLTRNFAWHLRKSGAIESSRDLGICTPYAAQARLIQQLLEGDGLDEFVQAGTVHRYQGDERRIMFIEIPESHGSSRTLGQFVQGLPPDQLGARLMNVAVSRAQEHLVVMANLTYLDKRLPSSSLLRGVLYDMQEKGRVVPAREILGLRPIESDLAGLIGNIPFDELAESLCIFDEAQFEQGLMHDIHAAEKSVLLFSGYITPARVGKLGDLLRWKIAAGVKVRCVTRPPKLNGSIPEAAGREAIEILEGIGAVVDCRARIHQKVCLIDDRIVWWGSLNALSHMYHADETMTRVVNSGFAQVVIAHMSKRRMSVEKAVAGAANAENPRCPTCGNRTVLVDGSGVRNVHFYCEAECGWSQNLKPGEGTRARHYNSPSSHSANLPKRGPDCPSCGGETRLRSGRFGAFYGCARYPACDGKIPLPRR